MVSASAFKFTLHPYLSDPPSTIPLTSKSAFYEHVGIPGRGAESVRRQLYALFTQGLSVRAIRQVMSVHLEAWCLEADSIPTMAGGSGTVSCCTRGVGCEGSEPGAQLQLFEEAQVAGPGRRYT